MPSVPSIGPGAMQLIRMLLGPHSTARCLVMASMAALAEPACTWRESKAGLLTRSLSHTLVSHLQSLSSVMECSTDIYYYSTVHLDWVESRGGVWGSRGGAYFEVVFIHCLTGVEGPHGINLKH